MAGALEQDDIYGPFQPKLLFDTMKSRNAFQVLDQFESRRVAARVGVKTSFSIQGSLRIHSSSVEKNL